MSGQTFFGISTDPEPRRDEPMVDWEALMPPRIRARAIAAAEGIAKLAESAEVREAFEVAAIIHHRTEQVKDDLADMGLGSVDLHELLAALSGWDDLYDALADLGDRVSPDPLSVAITASYTERRDRENERAAHIDAADALREEAQPDS